MNQGTEIIERDTKGRFIAGHKVPNYIREKLSILLKGKIPYMKGKKGLYKHTEEHKEKMSKLMKGRKFPPISEETRTRLRLSHVGKMMGEKHPRWKGTSTEEHKFRESFACKQWMRDVFKRDDWTCVKCKKRGNDLNCHHIQSFNKYKNIRTDINNGVTMCKECHRSFHYKYGFKNFTKANYLEYIKS